MALSVGDKLGPYEILAPIGAGGMGEVYRAQDARLKREVALKILPEALAHDPVIRTSSPSTTPASRMAFSTWSRNWWTAKR
jgi:serine/threonine protein kinase